LILLLILLPLYLWPLRGGLGALPDSSTRPGSARDPRSAAAVAQIPGDVWDALMGHTHAPPPSAPPATSPHNLTMITEGLPGIGLLGSLDEGTRGVTGSDSPAARARGILAQLGSSDLSDGSPGGSSEPPSPVEFVSAPGGGTGPGGVPGGFGPGGHPSLGNLGPWHGAGPGGRPSIASLTPQLDPGGAGDLAPTPEPATLLLIGSNLALLGAAALRRWRRGLGIPPVG
jgi:hypothetical protein